MQFHIGMARSAALDRAVRAVTAELHDLVAGRLGNLLGNVAKFEAQQADQAFASEGAKSGAKWPGLLEGEGNMKGYAAWKRRNWTGKKLNVWRGDTRDSIRHVSNKDHIARGVGDVLQFGTKAPLAAKMQEGESHSAWQKVFLKEKSPVFPKGARSEQRRNRRSGRFEPGKEMVVDVRGQRRSRRSGRFMTGTEVIGKKTVKGRNWFTFWYKTIPARPVVRKSPSQVKHLKLAISRELVARMAYHSRGSSLYRGFAEAARGMRPDPRA